MNTELILTSAPRGLIPGSQGFTTVAMTRGMPQPLADRLEALSGYRFEAIHPGSKPPVRPINYAHMCVVFGGRRWSILSRVAPAGADYRGRPNNKIAHHIVIQDDSKPAGGPAWLLEQPNIFTTQWSGEPELRERPPELPAGGEPHATSRTWKELTGDSGWAGELLRVLAEEPQRRVFVVIPEGADGLRLIAEALSHFYPEDRWEITFATAFMGAIPNDVDCRVRFVCDNLEGRRLAAGALGAVVFDLTQLRVRSLDSDSDFVRKVRKGEMVRLRSHASTTLVLPVSRTGGASVAWGARFGAARDEHIGEEEPALLEPLASDEPLPLVPATQLASTRGSWRSSSLVIGLLAGAFLAAVAISLFIGVEMGRVSAEVRLARRDDVKSISPEAAGLTDGIALTGASDINVGDSDPLDATSPEASAQRPAHNEAVGGAAIGDGLPSTTGRATGSGKVVDVSVGEQPREQSDASSATLRDQIERLKQENSDLRQQNSALSEALEEKAKPEVSSPREDDGGAAKHEAESTVGEKAAVESETIRLRQSADANGTRIWEGILDERQWKLLMHLKLKPPEGWAKAKTENFGEDPPRQQVIAFIRNLEADQSGADSRSSLGKGPRAHLRITGPNDSKGGRVFLQALAAASTQPLSAEVAGAHFDGLQCAIANVSELRNKTAEDLVYNTAKKQLDEISVFLKSLEKIADEDARLSHAEALMRQMAKNGELVLESRKAIPRFVLRLDADTPVQPQPTPASDEKRGDPDEAGKAEGNEN